MKKLFFVDIDGTILDGSRNMKKVSGKTRYAMRELKKENNVFIASGRCKGLLDPDILSLDTSGFVLCNGAYAEVEGKEIFSMYFTKEALDAIRRVVKKYDGFVILEAIDEMFVDSKQSRAYREYMHSWGSALDGFAVGGEGRSDYLISMIGFADRSILKNVEEELAPYVDLAAHKQYSSYDVNIKGINKGAGVKKIMEYLKAAPEDCYSFGDAINDLEMLQCVGHPVVVDNCVPELKTFGFEQTDDVLDEGFYNYCVSHKLIKAL